MNRKQRRTKGPKHSRGREWSASERGVVTYADRKPELPDIRARKVLKAAGKMYALTQLAKQRGALEKELTRTVRAARRDGASWTQIGLALGVTQQAASKRWGPYPVRTTTENPLP